MYGFVISGRFSENEVRDTIHKTHFYTYLCTQQLSQLRTFVSEFSIATPKLQNLVIQHRSQEILKLGFLSGELFAKELGCNLKLVALSSLGNKFLCNLTKPAMLNISRDLCPFTSCHIMPSILIQSRTLRST